MNDENVGLVVRQLVFKYTASWPIHPYIEKMNFIIALYHSCGIVMTSKCPSAGGNQSTRRQPRSFAISSSYGSVNISLLNG